MLLIPIIKIPETYNTYIIYNDLVTQGFFFATVLFTMGFIGLILNKQSFLISLMSLELMLLGLILNFTFISIFLKNPSGQIVALFIITLAAVESVVGLSLLIAINSAYKSISVNKVNYVFY